MTSSPSDLERTIPRPQLAHLGTSNPLIPSCTPKLQKPMQREPVYLLGILSKIGIRLKHLSSFWAASSMRILLANGSMTGPSIITVHPVLWLI